METLALSSVKLRGPGMHSGIPCSLRIGRREGLGGPRFFWMNRSEPIEPGDFAAFSRGARRSTRLRSHDLEIRTAEHLIAALVFFHDCPLDIHCDAVEPPGLDGSAAPFYQACAGLCPELASLPSWREFPSRLEFRHDGPEGVLQTEPSESFSVEYELDRPPLQQQFRLDHPAVAINEILPARTFIFSHEWDQAKSQGLLQGCGPDSGMLYASTEREFETAKSRNPDLRGKRFPLLHPETERVEQEAVKHKILDLLGDLALFGLALPRLRIRIRNGGHALNHLLLEQLQNERNHSDP